MSIRNTSAALRGWQRIRSRAGVHVYGVLAALIGTVLVWALFFIPGEKPEPLVVYAWVGSTSASVSRAQAEEDAMRAAAASSPVSAAASAAAPAHASADVTAKRR